MLNIAGFMGGSVGDDLLPCAWKKQRKNGYISIDCGNSYAVQNAMPNVEKADATIYASHDYTFDPETGMYTLDLTDLTTYVMPYGTISGAAIYGVSGKTTYIMCNTTTDKTMFATNRGTNAISLTRDTEGKIYFAGGSYSVNRYTSLPNYETVGNLVAEDGKHYFNEIDEDGFKYMPSNLKLAKYKVADSYPLNKNITTGGNSYPPALARGGARELYVLDRFSYSYYLYKSVLSEDLKTKETETQIGSSQSGSYSDYSTLYMHNDSLYLFCGNYNGHIRILNDSNRFVEYAQYPFASGYRPRTAIIDGVPHIFAYPPYNGADKNLYHYTFDYDTATFSLVDTFDTSTSMYYESYSRIVECNGAVLITGYNPQMLYYKDGVYEWRDVPVLGLYDMPSASLHGEFIFVGLYNSTDSMDKWQSQYRFKYDEEWDVFYPYSETFIEGLRTHAGTLYFEELDAVLVVGGNQMSNAYYHTESFERGE